MICTLRRISWPLHTRAVASVAHDFLPVIYDDALERSEDRPSLPLNVAGGSVQPTLFEEKVIQPTPYLFIGNIPPKTQARFLEQTLSAYGLVRFLRIQTSFPPACRWKGYAFVDFATVESAMKARNQPGGIILPAERELALSIHYNELSAGMLQMEKQLQEPVEPSVYDQMRPPYHKISVRNLPWSWKSVDLRLFMESYGEVRRIQTQYDLAGQRRQFAFVEFKSLLAAEQAVSVHSAADAPLYGGLRLVVAFVDRVQDLRYRPRRRIELKDVYFVDEPSLEDIDYIRDINEGSHLVVPPSHRLPKLRQAPSGVE